MKTFIKVFLIRLLSHYKFEMEKDQDLEVNWSSFKQQPKDGVKTHFSHK